MCVVSPGVPEGPKRPRAGLNHQDPLSPDTGKPRAAERGVERNLTKLKAVVQPLTNTHAGVLAGRGAFKDRIMYILFSVHNSV